MISTRPSSATKHTGNLCIAVVVRHAILGSPRAEALTDALGQKHSRILVLAVATSSRNKPSLQRGSALPEVRVLQDTKPATFPTGRARYLSISASAVPQQVRRLCPLTKREIGRLGGGRAGGKRSRGCSPAYHAHSVPFLPMNWHVILEP